MKRSQKFTSTDLATFWVLQSRLIGPISEDIMPMITTSTLADEDRLVYRLSQSQHHKHHSRWTLAIRVPHDLGNIVERQVSMYDELDELSGSFRCPFVRFPASSYLGAFSIVLFRRFPLVVVEDTLARPQCLRWEFLARRHRCLRPRAILLDD